MRSDDVAQELGILPNVLLLALTCAGYRSGSMQIQGFSMHVRKQVSCKVVWKACVSQWPRSSCPQLFEAWMQELQCSMQGSRDGRISWYCAP